MESEMALLIGEECVCRLLRKLLGDLPIGASLCDLERSQPEQTGKFFPCLEYFLPAVLSEIHQEWRNESFDGFLPLCAKKVDEREAEFYGPCVLISDHKWIPFHLKIQIARSEDEVSWLELSVGECGNIGMKRSDLSTVYNRFYVSEQDLKQIDWAYHVTFGNWTQE